MSEPYSDQPAPKPETRRTITPPPRGVLVLGASVAGLRAAITLDRLLIGRRDHRIVLVDQQPYHQIRPRLAAVLGGEVKPQAATVAVRRLLGARRVEFVQARVESVDLEMRRILTSAGDLGYGHLVLALGVESSPSGVPGLDEAAAEVSSVDDARQLGERVVGLMRQAAWKLDSDERSRLSTLVVVGGSRFGVELAGALGERVRALAASFRLPAGDGRVILVEPSEQLMPTDSRGLGEAASHTLTSLGVEMRLGTAVTRAWAGGVELASGETIPAGLIVRTSPGRALSLVRTSGAALGRDGRLLVDRELRLPEHIGVYGAGPGTTLLGDVVEGEDAARDAAVQADVAAQNLFAELVGSSAPKAERRQYVAAPGDVAIPIGSRDAIAQIRGLVVSGWRARLALEAAQLAYFESIGGPSGLVTGLTSHRASLGRLLRR